MNNPRKVLTYEYAYYSLLLSSRVEWTIGGGKERSASSTNLQTPLLYHVIDKESLSLLWMYNPLEGALRGRYSYLLHWKGKG